MGNVTVAGELASAEELEELYKLNASESQSEGEEDDQAEKEGAESGGMPNDPKPGGMPNDPKPEGMPHD